MDPDQGGPKTYECYGTPIEGSGWLRNLRILRIRIRNTVLKLLNFYFNADPNPAFYSTVDPDPGPASKNKEDSDLQADIKRDCLMFILGGIIPISRELHLVHHD
jgi:hypothetical protein